MSKSYKLYQGSLRLDFEPSGHRYTVTQNGVTTHPVGATTILKVISKPALMLWPLNMALDYLKDFETITEGLLEEAAAAHTKRSDIGKGVGAEVHEAIEWALLAIKTGNKELLFMDVSDEARPALSAFDKWFTDMWPKVIDAEQPVYSVKYGYAGKFDALLEIDGQLVLCDVKTSNPSRTAPLGIYAENFLQLGGYSLAYNEERMKDARVKPISDLMVINANKEGRLSTLRASEVGLSVKHCEQMFVRCVELYNFMDGLSKQLKERK